MWRKAPEAKPFSESANPPTSGSAKPQEPVLAPAAIVPTQPPSAPTPAQVVPMSEPAAAPTARGTSKISSGLKINGELSGTSDLYIEGEVHGKIRLGNGRVTVGPNGKVEADIEAREIVIDGTVKGTLKAGERAHFGPSSRAVATVLTPRIGIDDGARLQGKVETTQAAPVREPSPAAKQKAESYQPVTADTKVE